MDQKASPGHGCCEVTRGTPQGPSAHFSPFFTAWPRADWRGAPGPAQAQPRCQNSGTPPQAEPGWVLLLSPCFHAPPPYPLPPGPPARTCFPDPGKHRASVGGLSPPCSTFQPSLDGARAKQRFGPPGRRGMRWAESASPQAAWGAAWLAGTHPVFESETPGRRLRACQSPPGTPKSSSLRPTGL